MSSKKTLPTNVFGVTNLSHSDKGIRKVLLLLRNWIRSGVNRISDLEFIDGKLDENYIYQKIRLSGGYS